MASPNYFSSSKAAEFGGDETYYSKQLHFHTESEHTIDTKRFDLEMHIVHQAVDKTADVRTANPDDATV